MFLPFSFSLDLGLEEAPACVPGDRPGQALTRAGCDAEPRGHLPELRQAQALVFF